MPFIIVFAAIIVIIAVIARLQDRHVERKRAALRAEAEKSGMHTLEITAPQLLANSPRFMLFTQGTSPGIVQAGEGKFTRPEGSAIVTVFTYMFDISMGRFTRSWRQTALRVISPDMNLPGFNFMPEIVFEQMIRHIRDETLREQLAGMAKISFPDHTTFRQIAHARRDSHARVLALFDEGLLHFLNRKSADRSHDDLCIEGSGQMLLLYRYDYEIAAEDLQGFLDAGLAVFEAFLTASRRAATGTATAPPDRPYPSELEL